VRRLLGVSGGPASRRVLGRDGGGHPSCAGRGPERPAEAAPRLPPNGHAHPATGWAGSV